MAHLVRFAVLCVALASIGCSAYEGYAGQAADSADTMVQEAMFVAAAMDMMTPATAPDDAAQAAADAAGNFFRDGCFTATADGPAVTYRLVDCSGPFGVEGIDGTVTTTYRSLEPTGVGFDIVASGLSIEGHEASFTIAAEVAGDTRSSLVATSAEMVGPRGTALTREGSYRMRWGVGTQCAGFDGTYTTAVDGITWDTTVTEYSVCGDACPGSTGSVEITSGRGTITLTFDGSARAAWDAGSNGAGTLVLACSG